MKIACLALALLAGCANDYADTTPQLQMSANAWIEGQPISVTVVWSSTSSCSSSNPLDCSTQYAPPFTVAALTCNGCTILSQSADHSQFSFVANTTGAVTIDAAVEAEGTIYHATATKPGQREVALAGACTRFPRDLLGPDGPTDSSDEVDCASYTMRFPDEALLIGAEVVFQSGDELPLECAGSDSACAAPLPIAYAPAPDSIMPDGTAIYLALDPSIATITLTSTLLSGDTATTTVAVPPLGAAPTN